jgi:chromosome segregation ATPase
MRKTSKSKTLRSKGREGREGSVSHAKRKPPAKTRTSHPLKKTGCTNGASRPSRLQTRDTGPGARPSVQCCAGTRTHAGHVAHQLGHIVDVAEGALARSARGPGAAARADLRTHLNELHASLDAAFAAQAADCLGIAVERELNHWEDQHLQVQQTQQQASAQLHEARRELSSVRAKLSHCERERERLELRAGRAEHDLLSEKTKVREYKQNHDGLVDRNGKLEARVAELEQARNAAAPSASRFQLERLRADLEAARTQVQKLQTENDLQLADWKRQSQLWGERNAKLEHERDNLVAELERTREQLVHATAPPLTPDTIGAEAERVVRAALEDHAHIDHFARLLLAILTRGERERDELERRLGSLENSLRIALEDHAGG